MRDELNELNSRTGTLEQVWLVRVQASPDETERIIDKVMEVDPLAYGRYERNAFVSAIGSETYKPLANSTSALHIGAENQIQHFPCVEVLISLRQDRGTLELVLDAIRDAHHYEEPLIFVEEAWASRAAYNPRSTNPNRWWNRANAG